MLKELGSALLKIVLYPVKLASKLVAKLLGLIAKVFDRVSELIQRAEDKVDEFANK